MIAAEYANGCMHVNALSCLSINNQRSKKHNMTLGERLKAARRHAKLDTQEQLAKKSGVSQQTISKIERDLVDSSGYVVHLAKACGVRPEWLAMEDGEMISTPYTEDPKAKAVLLAMEQMPEYKKDMLVAASNTLAEQPAQGANGTK